MTLSNIFREPRREITESVVGVAAAAALVYADWVFANWIYDPSSKNSHAAEIAAGMALGVILGALAVLFIILTHSLGDAICNALQARGVHLRPRERR